MEVFSTQSKIKIIRVILWTLVGLSLLSGIQLYSEGASYGDYADVFIDAFAFGFIAYQIGKSKNSGIRILAIVYIGLELLQSLLPMAALFDLDPAALLSPAILGSLVFVVIFYLVPFVFFLLPETKAYFSMKDQVDNSRRFSTLTGTLIILGGVAIVIAALIGIFGFIAV